MFQAFHENHDIYFLPRAYLSIVQWHCGPRDGKGSLHPHYSYLLLPRLQGKDPIFQACHKVTATLATLCFPSIVQNHKTNGACFACTVVLTILKGLIARHYSSYVLELSSWFSSSFPQFL